MESNPLSVHSPKRTAKTCRVPVLAHTAAEYEWIVRDFVESWENKET